MTPAVLYARVSSKEQAEEGFSISAQLKLLRKYAADNGFEVVEEFRDVETAKSSGRPGFMAMASYLCNAPDGTVILVEKTDRLYRNFRDYVTLEDLDPVIHLVKENSVLSEDSRSHEKLMHYFKLVMVKSYVDNLGEEASKGMREKAEQGTWPSCAPIGYKNVTVGNRRAIALHPHHASVVKHLFELYATRTYSLSELVEIAAEEGLRTVRGHAPTKSTIHRMLGNVFYTGRFIWDEREYEGDHPPLVSEDLFARVREALDDGHHGFARTRRSYAYMGLLTCEQCGCSITAGMQKHKYVYYRCTGARGNCKPQYIREEKLEELLRELVVAVRIDDEMIEWVVRALKESHGEEKEFRDSQIGRLEGEVKRLQERLDRAYEDRLDGTISEEQWQRLAQRWRAEKATLLRGIERHDRANDMYLDCGVRLLRLAEQAPDLWDEQPQEERRKLLDVLLLNCTFDGESLRATWRKPFCWLAEGSPRRIWRG